MERWNGMEWWNGIVERWNGIVEWWNRHSLRTLRMRMLALLINSHTRAQPFFHERGRTEDGDYGA